MLDLLSKIYGFLVSRRNKAFDNGKIDTVKLPVPVISVGNISAGGTGKTPFVIMLANTLIKLNFQIAIVGRGYKRIKKDTSIISDGKEIFGSWQNAGDEMYMLAKIIPAPIVVNESKSEAAKIATENFSPDCIIVDDGFQHRYLQRDLDIVLIDQNTLTNPKLIPEGRLREPLESLKRADVIVLVGDINNTDIIDEYLSNHLIIRTQVKPGNVYSLFTNENIKDEELKNAIPIAVSGLGNPQKFEKLLTGSGCNIMDHIKFPDHKNYRIKNIKKIIQKCKSKNANSIITTEKDAVKLKDFEKYFIAEGLKCYVFSIEMLIIDNEDIIIQKIVSLINP